MQNPPCSPKSEAESVNSGTDSKILRAGHPNYFLMSNMIHHNINFVILLEPICYWLLSEEREIRPEYRLVSDPLEAFSGIRPGGPSGCPAGLRPGRSCRNRAQRSLCGGGNRQTRLSARAPAPRGGSQGCASAARLPRRARTKATGASLRS